MNRILISILTATLALGIFHPATAQEKSPPFVFGGGRGNTVLLGTTMVSKAKPANGVVLYRIERQEQGRQEQGEVQSGSGAWQPVADVSAPNTFAEFKLRLADAATVSPQPFSLPPPDIERIWTKADSMRGNLAGHFYASLLPVRLALGIAYLDTAAKRGVRYRYRASMIDLSGNALKSRLSESVSYPARLDMPKPVAVSVAGHERDISLTWLVKTKLNLSFSAYRQENGLGAFTPVSVHGVASRQKDSLLFGLRDTTVKSGNVYKYFIVPEDYYGNLGAVSDTVVSASYQFGSTMTPTRLSALSNPNGLGIRLSWRIPQPQNLAGVEIQRSTEWEKNYRSIAVAAPTDTVYTDESAEPMQRYYYRFVMRDLLGDSAAPSARVFGIYQSATPPVRPRVEATSVKGGVRLLMTSSEKNILGYRVYRLADSAMTLISGLLPPQDSATVFVDSGAGLSGGARYAYAVRSESRSHILSRFSDTVRARPLIATEPPAPVGLSVRVLRDSPSQKPAVYLSWIRPSEPALQGYRIFRRTALKSAPSNSSAPNSSNSQRPTGQTASPRSFTALVDTLLSADRNHFTDSSAAEGSAFDYAVQALDDFGGRSAMSVATVSLEQAAAVLAPPAGLRAMSSGAGVMLEWDEVEPSRLTGYKLYRYERSARDNVNAPPQVVAVLKPAQVSFADKTVKAGNLYFYYLTSVGTDAPESAPGEEIGIRP